MVGGSGYDARQDVYHIAERDAWALAAKAGAYRPASLAREGFIHCSTRPQVLDTAQRFYAGRDDLLLLRIDAVALGDALRYEAPVPPSAELQGVLFPHLYGPLPVAVVRAVAVLGRDGAGCFTWPLDAGFA